jgi:hypothetical protein
MTLKLRYFLCLAAILATTICLSTQRKTKPKQTTAPVSMVVQITANTGHDDDKQHCFKSDPSRELIFHIAANGMSAGTATVELVDMGKMSNLPQTPSPDPAPSIKSEIRTASVNSGKANVTFSDPGPFLRLPDGVHLGPGPYVAMVSLVSPNSRAVKPDLTIEKYLYYYETWTLDKPCSKP